MPYIAVSALSHTGLVRDHNEDSLVVGPWTLCGTETENPQTLVFELGTPLLVAVADGLGGHPGGEVASTLVVRRLAGAGPLVDGEASLREALQACNRAVYSAAERNPELTAMGTTVAGVVVTAEAVFAFNVGDSRVYEITERGLSLISMDDSPPLAPGERSTVIVTQTLGGRMEFLEVDPHIDRRALSLDARYLVCTDGLTDLVTDDEIAERVRDNQGGRSAYRLWEAAINAGGIDNITLAVVRFAA